MAVESCADADVVAAEVMKLPGLGISWGTSACKKEFKLSDKVDGAADRRLNRWGRLVVLLKRRLCGVFKDQLFPLAH